MLKIALLFQEWSKGFLCLAGVFCGLCVGCGASALAQSGPDYLELSLEELLEIEITSVAKKPGRLNDAAAAIFVITREDLRRSGVTSIPEALRMVPGVQVARIDASKWAISARGSNGRFANKLLVLMDGRSVYTPLFSGVYWDIQDTLLEDVERIEVIRGPGATLWGANAVNGVINIITRPVAETRGWLVSAAAGDPESLIGGLRYGTTVGSAADMRVYAKFLDHDTLDSWEDIDAADDWHTWRGGFRLDAAIDAQQSLTLQGDLYQGSAGQTDTVASLLPPDYVVIQEDETDFSGGNLLARWSREGNKNSRSVLQVYYDVTRRDDPGTFDEKRHTLDVDFQHNFTFGQHHEFIWGFGYRQTRDSLDQVLPYTLVTQRKRTDHLYSLFGQVGWVLIPDRLRLVFGSKFEKNDYTGLEVQPNARLVWTIDDHRTLWVALSRAVRTPSRGEDDARLGLLIQPADPGFPSMPPTLITASGDRSVEAENLLAWEVGYRTLMSERLSFDLSAFYNHYTDHRTAEFGLPELMFDDGMPYLLLENVVDNKASLDAYGFELAADWQMRPWWRLKAGYSYLKVNLDLAADSVDIGSSLLLEEANPEHQVSFRSLMNLSDDFELDLWLRYVDSITNRGADAYTTLDIRFGYFPVPNVELFLVGQNLFAGRRLEFVPEYQLVPTEVGPAVYGKIVLTF